MVRLFNLYVPFALVALALADATLLGVAWQVAAAIPGLDPSGAGFHASPEVALVISPLGLLFFYSMGVYQAGSGEPNATLLARIAVALLALAGAGALLSLAQGAGFPTLPRLGAAVFLGLVFTLALRLSLVPRTVAVGRTSDILVIGAGRRAADLDRLDRKGVLGRVRVSGYLPLPGEGRALAEERILATNDLPRLCERLGTREVVVAADGPLSPTVADTLWACRRRGIRVVEYANFLERERGQLPADDPDAPWLLFDDAAEGIRGLDKAGKRAFDLLLSGFLLLLTLPVTLVTALLVKLEDGGPVFYAQERVGLDGKTFKVLKFRSMRVDAEADGKARFAQVGDPRVTRIGRFIRLVRIDEIPQVLNVLRGEMSFIGPRPERPSIVAELVRDIPTFALRHRVKPGITGWAQVNYPYGATVEDSLEKLRYDLFYVKNSGFVLDLLILLQTVRVVVWADGAR